MSEPVAKSTDTQTTVMAVVSRVLESEEVTLETSIFNCQRWDSLNHLKILVELESAFSCSLPLEEIGDVNSVRDWVSLIHRTIESPHNS